MAQLLELQGRERPEGDRTSGAVEAARWFGAAHALRTAIGVPLPPVEGEPYERSVEALRSVLGHALFATAWEEGSRRMLDHLEHPAGGLLEFEFGRDNVS
jgi:hypothetical protein